MMNATTIALWLLSTSIDTTAQLLFKAAASHTGPGAGLAWWRHMMARPWVWLGGGLYIIEFPAWTAFLSLVPLGRGVLLGSISIVTIMLAGRVLFGERLTPMRVAGILLIAVGVGLVGAGT